MGDVEDSPIHFSLKMQREHPPKPSKLTMMGGQFRAQWKTAGLPLTGADGNFLNLRRNPNCLPALSPTSRRRRQVAMGRARAAV